MILSNIFQFLNNITRISIHFFIHTYFQKIQTTLLKQYYQTASKISQLQKIKQIEKDVTNIFLY